MSNDEILIILLEIKSMIHEVRWRNVNKAIDNTTTSSDTYLHSKISIDIVNKYLKLYSKK